MGTLLIRARDDPSTLVSSGYWVGKQGDPFYEAVRAANVGARFAWHRGSWQGGRLRSTLGDSANGPRGLPQIDAVKGTVSHSA